MKIYESKNVTLPAGAYYVEGSHSSIRESLIASVVHETSACAVSYENFCKALGLPKGSEAVDTAFRGAVDALLEADMPVVIVDVATLDQADIALYGFDGPSELKELKEHLEYEEENNE